MTKPAKKSKPTKKPKNPKPPKKNKKKTLKSSSQEKKTSTMAKSDPLKSENPESWTKPLQAQPEKPKRSMKSIALYVLLGCIIIALLITVIVLLMRPDPVLTPSPEVSTEKPRNVCESKKCITLAHQLHNWQDTSVDPCQDFFKYSCGKYNEHTVAYGATIHKKRTLVSELIKEFLLKNQTTTSKSEKAMRHFFRACNEKKRNGAIDYLRIFVTMKTGANWPMMEVHTPWDPKRFDLTAIMLKTAHVETPTPDYAVVNFGLFSMYIAMNRKIYITENAERPIPGFPVIFEQMKGMLRFITLTTIMSQQMQIDIQGVLEVDQQLSGPTADINKAKDSDFTAYSKTDLSNQIKLTDFEKLFSSFFTPSVWQEMKKHTAVHNDLLRTNRFNGVFHDERRLANYIYCKYFYSILQLVRDVRERKDCHESVMRYLPYATLRAYAQNHFDRENVEIVSDLIEELKGSFAKMIQKSTWLQEESKKKAVLKVEKMKKMVGYPKQFRAAGALDNSFEFDTSPEDTLEVLLMKIDKTRLGRLLDYVSLKTILFPYRNYLSPNAFHYTMGNSLAVLVPLMDSPFFDSSYPKYANLGGVGYIIGHEIGHGLDSNGVFHDENGKLTKPWKKVDYQEFRRRGMCLVKQYDTYDDPAFGKKLNGSLAINELIADQLGADAAWNTFKSIDSSNEPRIIGIEDYDVDKLYFQIQAMNWCSPRANHSLAEQLQDTHATLTFRVNGVMANMKQFGETFNCPVGSPMNPEKKCELF